MLIEVMSYAGIPTLRFTQWEGDDLQYILTKISSRSRILTDDKDLLQLVSDDTDVRRPMADELVTKNSLLESHNYTDVYEFVMNKAIIGDGSDNIPGSCKGVGAGTSINLIRLIEIFKEQGIDFSVLNESNSDKIKEICKDNGLKYRKAMLDFDVNRYNTNIELVDLNLVEVNDDILQSIYSTIDNCRNTVNYFTFVKKLNQLGIREISADELINNVSERFSVLKKGNN